MREVIFPSGKGLSSKEDLVIMANGNGGNRWGGVI